MWPTLFSSIAFWFKLKKKYYWNGHRRHIPYFYRFQCHYPLITYLTLDLIETMADNQNKSFFVSFLWKTRGIYIWPKLFWRASKTTPQSFVVKSYGFCQKVCQNRLFYAVKAKEVHESAIYGHCARPSKGQKKSKWYFQVEVSSKKRTNVFYFTTMKPQVDLFLFVFWRKLKTPKRHFEIIWPLAWSNYL